MPTSSFHRTAALLATAALWLSAAPVAAAPSPAARCARAKLTAVTAAAQATVRCHARAIRRGDPVDQTCLTEARSGLATAFQRAEAKGGCASTNDAAALQDDVDLFVNLALLKLAPPGPTPTPGPSPTPTVSPDCANPDHWACCSLVVPGLGSCSSLPWVPGITGGEQLPHRLHPRGRLLPAVALSDGDLRRSGVLLLHGAVPGRYDGLVRGRERKRDPAHLRELDVDRAGSLPVSRLCWVRDSSRYPRR